MKKSILLAGLLIAAFFTHAEGKFDSKNLIQKSTFQNQLELTIPIESIAKILPTCTVSLKGSLYLGILSVEITCTGTGTTCKEATEKAASCLAEATKTLKDSLS